SCAWAIIRDETATVTWFRRTGLRPVRESSTDRSETCPTQITFVDPALAARVVLELLDQPLQLRRHARQLLRGLLRVAGALGCVLRRLGHRGDVAGDLRAAARRVGPAHADLAGRRRLLFHGAGDRALVVVDLNDDLADLGNRLDGPLRHLSDRVNLL